ncbi:MAG TPA: hypothetical protein VMC86_02720 [Gemmatimonadales bacterium]|nr:hypothetical protein [Gemmatimonadales bacterium]
MTSAGRVATVAAVGFLLCDAILLIYGAVEFRRPVLAVAGGAFALLAALVFAWWRRHLRLLEELTAARREMRVQVEEMRELIRRRAP